MVRRRFRRHFISTHNSLRCTNTSGKACYSWHHTTLRFLIFTQRRHEYNNRMANTITTLNNNGQCHVVYKGNIRRVGATVCSVINVRNVQR